MVNVILVNRKVQKAETESTKPGSGVNTGGEGRWGQYGRGGEMGLNMGGEGEMGLNMGGGRWG